MADSLVLTGVKDVKKHTGTEMVRLNPKGGGDTFQLNRWWVEGGVSTVYVKATVFDVTTAAGTVKLALDTSSSTNVRIDHDGSFNFTFFGVNEVGRAALYTDAFELIEHYVFPKISGGKIMTVTPAGAADRPTGGGGGGGGEAATGPVTSVTMTNTSTNESDGDVEDKNTVSDNGSGLTVDYSISSGVISSVVVNEAGDGYEAGDEFTIVGTGGTAKGTVSI